MQRVSTCWRSLVLQLLDRRDHPHPHRLPFQIPGLEAHIRLSGSEDRRVLTVLVDEELGRAVDVEIVWHGQSRLPRRHSQGSTNRVAQTPRRAS